MNRVHFIFLRGLIFFIISCADQPSQEQSNNSLGKELSLTICSSCHKYPEPGLLDKETWEKAMLPRMGNMLGIYENDTVRNSLIEEGEGGNQVEMSGLFPLQALITDEEWQQIMDYYLDNAPEKIEVLPKQIAIGKLPFKVYKPPFKVTPPSTTMVKINDRNEVYFGDAHSKKLFHLSSELEILKAGNVSEGAVSIAEINDDLWITVMGSFAPEDAPKGFVLNLPVTGGEQALVAVDQLRRPVHTAYGDLNSDGEMDMVVSEFGKWTGRLSLFMGKGNKTFEHKVLINQTGALRSYIEDFNNDGKKDIIALFGQGNESIYIFYNLGNGNFSPNQVLQFSPSNGSTYFNLFDFNDDGYQDIIYCAGDNADFKPIMKLYHGIYIFQNDGKNKFTQVFFQHLNGAYGAIPEDFDLDGDIDIAAISFFPDYEKSPEESFVYMENKGTMEYDLSTFPDVTMGRWIVMDAEDIDDDGDADLILGSMAFEVVPENGLVQKWVQNGIPFVILENTTKQ